MDPNRYEVRNTEIGGNRWLNPALFIVLFDWGMGLGNASGGHFTVHGTRETIDADRWTIQPENKGQKSRHLEAEPAVSHMENWLECLRSRRRPSADIEFGYQHVVATVMAAQALETGRRQTYDPKKSAILLV